MVNTWNYDDILIKVISRDWLGRVYFPWNKGGQGVSRVKNTKIMKVIDNIDS